MMLYWSYGDSELKAGDHRMYFGYTRSYSSMSFEGFTVLIFYMDGFCICIKGQGIWHAVATTQAGL